jgi:hypothetical protein
MKYKFSAACLLAVLLAQSAQAVSLTGTYTTGGATTGTGPWNISSTDSTFSVLRFVLSTPTAFQNITDLSYGYDANLGGIGGGGPRAVFVFDSNNDTFADFDLTVHWGPAGTFVDHRRQPDHRQLARVDRCGSL